MRTVNLTATDSYFFDALRIGTTYDSVVAAVPEPSSLVLTLMGGLGLVGLAWRTRRTARSGTDSVKREPSVL